MAVVWRDRSVEVTAYAAKDESRRSVFVKFLLYFLFVFPSVAVVVAVICQALVGGYCCAAEQKMKCEEWKKQKLSLTYCRNRKSDRSIYIVGVVVVVVIVVTVDVLDATVVVVYIRYSILGWRIFLHTLDMH